MRPSDMESATYARGAPETDLTSPSFDAKTYLAVTHATSSYSSLQNELKGLKRTTSDKTEQLKALVSAHFDQYLSCHEAVRALSDDIRAHQKDDELLLTDMKTLKSVTDSTLSVMLQRAKEQRRIRNTLAVLNRFRPVFEITTKMKESLQSRDYDKLAEDYCRLKFHQTKANIAALQPVLAAAHEIAEKANAELLRHFDDISLSIKDQKRAITVLEALGLTEKPVLVCLVKQLGFLEARLAAMQQQSDTTDASSVVTECAAVIYRFRSGLWGFICDVFKPPSSGARSAQAITSTEAESIQQKAWGILSKSVELIEQHTMPPSVTLLKQLNESFREVNSLKKCANATLLTTNIAQLRNSFCDKFRIKIVLVFLQQTFAKHREELASEYFDPTATLSLQSLATETSLNVLAATSGDSNFSVCSSSNMHATKTARLIAEASTAFDEIRNTSMVSSESKVRLSRASVLTVCCTDIMTRWSYIWKHVGNVLMAMAESNDSSADGASEGIDPKTFRTVLVKEFKHQLHAMLASLLETLFDKFSSAIAPPSTMASVAGSMRSRDGPGVCVLFAIVANCIELRERHLLTVDKWVAQLAESSSAVPGGTAELRQLLLDVEAKCMDKYVTMHSEPLLRVLCAGAAEEAQQSRALLSAMAPPVASASSSGASSRTASLRVDSRTASSASFDLAPPPTPTAASIAAAANSQNSIPQDSRQYVFNVLLQLITLRSEVETSLGHFPQCHEYVRTVSVRLTAILASFLQDATAELEAAPEPSEWKRIHLLVETRFFLFALRDYLSDDAKRQLLALEKALEPLRVGDKAAMAQAQLLAQLKHQTKLYLLALQQG